MTQSTKEISEKVGLGEEFKKFNSGVEGKLMKEKYGVIGIY